MNLLHCSSDNKSREAGLDDAQRVDSPLIALIREFSPDYCDAQDNDFE
jgi:hypothetical protein